LQVLTTTALQPAEIASVKSYRWGAQRYL